MLDGSGTAEKVPAVCAENESIVLSTTLSPGAIPENENESPLGLDNVGITSELKLMDAGGDAEISVPAAPDSKPSVTPAKIPERKFVPVPLALAVMLKLPLKVSVISVPTIGITEVDAAPTEFATSFR